MYHVIMSPSDMFGSKHFATGCATMNINVNIMLTPIHIIRMAPISLEFTKEHKTSFFRGCASSRLDEKHNQVLGSTTKVQTVAYSNFAKNAKKAKKVSTS